MLRWFSKKGYFQGMSFAFMFLALGPLLDAIMKTLGTRLPPIEVIFFRFLFAFLTILPLTRFEELYISLSGSKNVRFNLLRGILGFVAFLGCIYSVKLFPIAEVTMIFWTMPFFALFLAKVFLKEKIGKTRLYSSIIGFLGLIFWACPYGISINLNIMIPICTAILFASQDIIIKKIVIEENRLCMLASFALIVMCLSIVPAVCVWVVPTADEFFYMFILGIGANALQYCIFRAYDSLDVSSIAPFRYVELVFAIIFGYAFFREIPGFSALIAALFIIPSTLYLFKTEVKRIQNK